RGAVQPLIDRLAASTEDQGQAFVALALGMIGDARAIVPLKTVVARSEYRPDSLEQASVARALGKIGDVRTIQPLLELIANKELPTTTRAFAVVALGQVGDLDLLP